MIDYLSPGYEKLENWIRGSSPPKPFKSGQYEQWHKAVKEASPFRYWLAETLLYKLVALINWPEKSIDHLAHRSSNRWITKPHALTAHPKVIPRGEWCDLSDRFLPCMFNELVNFVEREKAWARVRGCKESQKAYGRPWIYRHFFFHTWRCQQAGIDHLKWEAALTDECDRGQALAAIEIHELYTWWKEIIPARNAAEKNGDWDSYYYLRRSKGFNTVPIRDENEEEQMMIRLIRIRHMLWT